MLAIIADVCKLTAGATLNRCLCAFPLQESGADLAALRTWRRKFIWFPADSQRPPFYGSCKPRCAAAGGGQALPRAPICLSPQ